MNLKLLDDENIVKAYETKRGEELYITNKRIVHTAFEKGSLFKREYFLTDMRMIRAGFQHNTYNFTALTILFYSLAIISFGIWLAYRPLPTAFNLVFLFLALGIVFTILAIVRDTYVVFAMISSLGNGYISNDEGKGFNDIILHTNKTTAIEICKTLAELDFSVKNN